MVNRNLSEIVAENKTIFLDTGIMNAHNREWFGQRIFPADHFSQLSGQVLTSIKDTMMFVVDTLTNPDIEAYTTSKVNIEFEKLKKILTQKFNELDTNPRIGPYFAGREKYRRTLFGDVLCSYKSACRHAAHKTFYPEDMSVFENLEKEVLAICKEEKVKQAQIEEYGEDKEDIHTDEEVITSAIYNSVMNNKSSNVLTSDSHLRTLMFKSLKRFYDYRNCSEVSKKLKINPVNIYFLHNNHTAECVS